MIPPFRDQMDEGLLKIWLSVFLNQLMGRAHLHDSALVHDRDATAELGLVHVMGGYEEGEPLVGETIEQFPEPAPKDRIDTARRFIQKQDFRPMQYGRGKADPLTPAHRQRPCGTVDKRAKVKIAFDISDSLPEIHPAQSVDGSIEF
jgi:hypothetical protein